MRRVRLGAARVGLLLALVAAAACERAAAPPEVAVGSEEGEAAPALVGTLPDGSEFSLERAREESVLVFYRGAFCGLCRVQLSQLQENLVGYRTAGARVVGVSLEPPETNAQTAAQLGLDYPIVSVDSATFRAWGVEFSEQGMPRPATFVLDRSGIIRFRHVGRHAADRATDADILTVLGRIGAR